mmetsp:Transcript_2992/g.3409  ORF Transcript_2992/g.3409 Transcript_2992/m.3409 type:complete len:114 (-) Transcript_2992:138-479(-)
MYNCCFIVAIVFFANAVLTSDESGHVELQLFLASFAIIFALTNAVLIIMLPKIRYVMFETVEAASLELRKQMNAEFTKTSKSSGKPEAMSKSAEHSISQDQGSPDSFVMNPDI